MASHAKNPNSNSNNRSNNYNVENVCLQSCCKNFWNATKRTMGGGGSGQRRTSRVTTSHKVHNTTGQTPKGQCTDIQSPPGSDDCTKCPPKMFVSRRCRRCSFLVSCLNCSHIFGICHHTICNYRAPGKQLHWKHFIQNWIYSPRKSLSPFAPLKNWQSLPINNFEWPPTNWPFEVGLSTHVSKCFSRSARKQQQFRRNGL